MTRNLLGARGIDRISITENNATTHGYPLYDGHGNCRAILTKNGSSYGTGNWRTYDVWGSVRSGSATGDPKSRYVASIGHVADDESSLIYMRARYYEPATGRFISEDPARHDRNWFAYCGNEPVMRSDPDGKCWDVLMAFAIGFLVAGTIAYSRTWSYGKAFAAGLVNGAACAVITMGCNAIGKAAALGTLSSGAAIALKMSIGGVLNLAAGFLISLITGDDFGLREVFLSMGSGALGGSITGSLGFLDDIVMAMLSNSLPNALGGFMNFFGG